MTPVKALEALFCDHFSSCWQKLEGFLTKEGFDSLLIDSGRPFLHFCDDQTALFRSNPHFKYFCPLDGEKHILHMKPGAKPKLYIYEPESFWDDIEYKVEGAFWSKNFEISYFRSQKERKTFLEGQKGSVHLGQEYKGLDELGFQLNPKSLIEALNWWRSQKSAYEIHCIREANRRGALAHNQVRKGFLEKKSELELYEAYLRALGETEGALPYEAIIGYNEKSAILHYRGKRLESKKDVLLIDAGANYLSYASDISRTYADEKACPLTFVNLLRGVEAFQLEICHEARAGKSFIDLQLGMYDKLVKLLLEEKVIQNCSQEEGVNLGLAQAFCPHSLGHMLGIQVHDVGGFQSDEKGTPSPADPRLPHSRVGRALRENEVVTIEPGLYFMPELLREKIPSIGSQYFNEAMIDKLIPFGGIRIEDNIVIQEGKAPLNLTREFL